LLKRDCLLRTQSLENLSLMVDGYHAETDPPAPKDKIVNQFSNRVTV
jgi:hypothetical protein